jgi:hypothetical protein
MHRKALIAIAVGSIIGATLPGAYADQQSEQQAAAAQHAAAQDAGAAQGADKADIRSDHQDLRADRGDMRTEHVNQHIEAASPKPGMTAQTLANNAAENSKKAQATQNVHKAWYHFW